MKNKKTTGESENSISRNQRKRHNELCQKLMKEHKRIRKKQKKYKQLNFEKIGNVYTWIDKITDENENNNI